MAAPTFKSALNNYGRTEADREHLKRWGEHERDPVWERIAADARRYGELPPIVDAPYSLFIGEALRARRFAEGEVSPASQRKRNQQREQQERSDLLNLAGKIDDMLRHYRACSKARSPVRVPSPKGPFREELIAKLSLDWLESEAHRLRQLAEKVSAGDPTWDWGPIRVRVSRQNGGKGKRNQSRKLGVFMQRMVNCMYQLCGKPRYDAVAMMTNIAFPDADVDEENVRSACRPTTRAGRRRSGALSPMK
jgi:hypothetical protein